MSAMALSAHALSTTVEMAELLQVQSNQAYRLLKIRPSGAARTIEAINGNQRVITLAFHFKI